MFEAPREIVQLLEEDKRYRLEAYVFVFQALNFAQEVLGMGTESQSEPPSRSTEEEETPERHVSGQELCEAIREYALLQYGYLAKTVLNSWGIKTTGDFGEIVFNLIEIGRMRKTDDDRREDFNEIYDFAVAFQEDFEISQPE